VIAPRTRWDLAWSGLVAFVVLGPMLVDRGYVLRGDMVFVPRQPWKDAWLGLDGSVGRFVPGDAVVSLLTHAVPGDLLQKLVLAGAFVAGGVGVARLVASQPFVARAAAVTLFLWNPWVHERLGIGQWGIVVGYLLLPWVVIAAVAWRDDPRRGWAGLTVVLGVSAACSPPAALVAAATALCVVGVRRWRPAAGLLGIAAVVNLPWVVPSVLSPSPLEAAEGQFAGFAAASESGAGIVLSVLSLGGIWKTSVVPPERSVAVLVVLACVLTVVALAGLRRARDPDPGTRRGLLVLAALAAAVALVPAYSPLQDTLDAVASRVPPLGLFRDSHRFLGPAALVLAVGVAAATGWVWERARPGLGSLRLVAVLLVLWPVLCLPSLAWGLRGALTPVDYPREWETVAAQMGARPTVVLPWYGGYRGFRWNDRTASLDPAPRYFAGPVLIDDRLFLDDRALPSEDPMLAAVGRALGSRDPAAALTELGIAQVLLEKGNGVGPDDLPDGEVLHDGPDLRLVAIEGPAGFERSGPPRIPVLAADVTALLAVFLACASQIRRAMYGVRQRR
jgi:hypothetical protein